MSKKHNTQHPDRSRSRYPERLQKRGLGKSPMLAEIEGTQGLRARQERREEQTGVPWPTRGEQAAEDAA
jgi:hypothetical protein